MALCMIGIQKGSGNTLPERTFFRIENFFREN